ncbi:MAG: spermidine/putrescine ABC transporter substrate-binding protein [Verrucomicrobiales bacterium]|nr:spermidine/putrescine ABC transporter substrate-binding protein [Verrucomicrobiales bacterium]
MRCLIYPLLILVGVVTTAPRASAAQALHVFIWSEYLDPEVVREFEQTRNAKLTIDLYEDAESMVAKLQNGGLGLYDIVVPPDHMVASMVKLGLLSPLRHENLPNLKNLETRFRAPPFDPKNAHTVAYQWGTVGIYFRKVPGQQAPDSWAAIFDARNQNGPFVLIDSMRDAIGAALKFRGHSFNATDATLLKEARDLLIDAKKRSVAMEGSVGGRNRVLGKTATAAMVYSGEAARGMAEDSATGYVIPKEGSQIWVDNLAVPAKAPHRDLAEQFINFLLEPKIGARISNFTQFATPNQAAREFIKKEDLSNPAIYPPADVLAKLEYLEDVGPKTRLFDQVWTQVKAR